MTLTGKEILIGIIIPVALTVIGWIFFGGKKTIVSQTQSQSQSGNGSQTQKQEVTNGKR